MPIYRDRVEFIELPTLGRYSFKNASIEVVGTGYLRNMLRIQSLGRLPILACGISWVGATYELAARHHLQTTHDDPRLDKTTPWFDPSLSSAKEKIRRDLQGEWFKRSLKGETKNGMEIGEIVLEKLRETGEAELGEGLKAVLIGMLTGMWTSFEVMLEELWNATIKERPSLNDGWSKNERKDSGFRSTKKLKTLYACTFRHDADDIQNIVSHEQVEGLALVRNLITHKLGKIDTEFDGRRGPSIPSLSCFDAFKLHQEIEITGPVVQHLIGPFPVLGLDLIAHVDKWITDHP